MNRLRAFLCDTRGTTAAEFALVLPVALLFFFGIIDGGRYVWAMNRLEKAVQMGTRTAVVTDVVASDLETADYVDFECPALDADGNPTTKPVQVGDQICAAAVPTVTCTSAGCGGGGFNSDAFANILARMRVVAPSLRDNEVTILQMNRWSNIYESRVQTAIRAGLSETFARDLIQAIHNESIRQQGGVMQSDPGLIKQVSSAVPDREVS